MSKFKKKFNNGFKKGRKFTRKSLSAAHGKLKSAFKKKSLAEEDELEGSPSLTSIMMRHRKPRRPIRRPTRPIRRPTHWRGRREAELEDDL